MLPRHMRKGLDRTLRAILAQLRRAATELLTGIEDVSSHSMRRIVLLGGATALLGGADGGLDRQSSGGQCRR